MNNENNDPKENERYAALKDFTKKALIVVGIVLVIVLASFAIVKIVPKITSSLALISVTSVPKKAPTSTTPDVSTPISTPIATTTTGMPKKTGEAFSGTADLSIRLLSTGILDKNTGAFSATTAIAPNDRAAIKFEVANIGTKNSGGWSWAAILPITGVKDTFTSEWQQSLAPGDRIEFTIGFDNLKALPSVKAIFSVDEGNTVPELREDNNSLTVTLTETSVPPYQYPYPNPLPYGRSDLSIRILDIGTQDRVTGIYTPTAQNYFDPNARIAVRFEVANQGTETAPNWGFIATFPSYVSPNYYSGAQASLAPGARTILTIAFDGLRTDANGIITINLDPYNVIAEIREDNNTGTIAVPYSNYYVPPSNYPYLNFNPYYPYNY